MFRNQYFVTNYLPDSDLDISVLRFDDLFICCLPDLSVAHESEKNTEIVILGYVIDPFSPAKDNQEIASTLAGARDTKDLMLQAQSLSGRYVVFYKSGATRIAFSDAFGHRQIYYSRNKDKFFLTSSPKLFLRVIKSDPVINDEKRKIIQSEDFRRNENAWFGDESIDDRLKKVLPNHYIDLNGLQVTRKFFDVSHGNTERDIQDLCARVLKGGIDGAVRRFKVMQTLTAGIDSRVLLAASKDYRDKIQYYVFKRPEMRPDYADIEIPLKLSRKLGINFQPLATEPLKDEFIEIYKSEHIAPRILNKTQNIQYHYYHSRPKGNVLDVKGNGAEVLRFFYGRSFDMVNLNISADMLIYLSRYSDNEFFKRKIEEWLVAARPFAEDYCVPLQDLFYWEQRMGNWGANHGLEQDIAIEEFWPFNNATLLLNGLMIDHNIRAWPKYAFFIQLIKDLWPDVLSEPINPKKNNLRKIGYYLNGFVKSNSHLEFFAKKLARRANIAR